MLLVSKWAEGERIDKINEKQPKRKRKIQLYMQLKQTKIEQLQTEATFVYGPASILSMVSNLVFLFHPFMVATR